jgi:hypothetical protein
MALAAEGRLPQQRREPLDGLHAQLRVEARGQHQAGPEPGCLVVVAAVLGEIERAFEGLGGGGVLPEQPERSAEALQGAGALSARLRVLGRQGEARRTGRISRCRLGLAQLGEKLGPRPGHRILVQSAAQEGDARVHAPGGQGGAPRLLERVEGPWLAEALGLEQVRGGSLRRRAGFCESARRAHMGTRPCSRRQPVIERRAHDSVAETHLGSRVEDLRAPQRLHRLEPGEVIELRHLRHAGASRLRAEHRRGLGERSGARGEPVEPEDGRAAHGLRAETHEALWILVAVEARGPCTGQEGLHQERHAAGLGGQGAQEVVGGVVEALRLGEGADSARAQRREPLYPREWYRLQPIRQVGVGSDLAARASTDDHHCQPLQALSQVQEELERAPVDPLQVVNGDQRHAPLGESTDQAPHAVESRLCGRAVAVTAGGRCREQRGGGACCSQERGPLERVGGAQARLEQLARNGEGVGRLQLAPARPQGGATDPLGYLAELGEKARLARARSALEDNERALGERAFERVHDQLQLCLSVDQMRRPRDGGRRREGPSHAHVF